MTSEMKYDDSPETSAPTGEGSMGHLDPLDIVRYKKGADQPIFTTL